MRAALFNALEEAYLNPPEDELEEPHEDTRDGSEFEGFDYPD